MQKSAVCSKTSSIWNFLIINAKLDKEVTVFLRIGSSSMSVAIMYWLTQMKKHCIVIFIMAEKEL